MKGWIDRKQMDKMKSRQLRADGICCEGLIPWVEGMKRTQKEIPTLITFNISEKAENNIDVLYL